jgi:hypothetical protein
VAVAVAGGGSGKKMDEIGLLLTELRLFVGRLGIAWLWQWQWLGWQCAPDLTRIQKHLALHAPH